jgi:hypothetical protein
MEGATAWRQCQVRTAISFVNTGPARAMCWHFCHTDARRRSEAKELEKRKYENLNKPRISARGSNKERSMAWERTPPAFRDP